MKPATEMLSKKKLVSWEQRVELLKGEQHIVVSSPQPMISMITLNRPECGNLMSHRTRAQLFNQLQLNDQDPDVRVTIIRGAGGTFSGGNDFDTNRDEVLPFFEPEMDGQTSRHILNGWFMLNDLAKPVVAMVEGEAIGAGLELAAACDVCVCAEDAKIGYSAVRGQGLGDYQILPWLCGMRNAMELILTNQPMTGIEAAKRNFVTEAVPRAELEERTLALAQRIAKIPSDLLAFNKKSVHRAFEEMGMRTYLRYGVDLEALMLKAPGAKMLVARRGPAGRPGAPAGKPGSRPPVPRPNATPSAPSAVAAQMVSAKSSSPAEASPSVAAKSAGPSASVPAPAKPSGPSAVSPSVAPKPVAAAPKPAASAPKAVASNNKAAPQVAKAPVPVAKKPVAAKAAEDVVEESNEDEPAPAKRAAAPVKAAAAPKVAPSTPAKAPVAAAKPPTTPAKTPVAAAAKATTTPSKPASTGAAKEGNGDVQIHLHEAVHIHIGGSPKTPSKL